MIIPDQKNMQIIIGILTIGFLSMSIWNIYQQHKFRQLELQLRQQQK